MKDKTGRQLDNVQTISKILTRMYTVLEEITVYLLHLSGNLPSHHARRLICRLGGIKIGKGSSIHMHARFYNPKNISIGEDSIIGEHVVLDGRDKLTIGNHVAIASEVMIYNSEHDISQPDFAPVTAKVSIEDYVFIGPRAIILPGVTIAKGAVIAAGAVVTKSVNEFQIAAGVPASTIGKRKLENPQYKLGRAAWFR